MYHWLLLNVPWGIYRLFYEQYLLAQHFDNSETSESSVEAFQQSENESCQHWNMGDFVYRV